MTDRRQDRTFMPKRTSGSVKAFMIAIERAEEKLRYDLVADVNQKAIENFLAHRYMERSAAAANSLAALEMRSPRVHVFEALARTAIKNAEIRRKFKGTLDTVVRYVVTWVGSTTAWRKVQP